MDFFGRRKGDLVTAPESASGQAVLQINELAKIAIVAGAGLFFGSMWYGVIDSSVRLQKIEGKFESLATKEDLAIIRADVLLLKQRSDISAADGLETKSDIKDFEQRVRDLEQGK